MLTCPIWSWLYNLCLSHVLSFILFLFLYQGLSFSLQISGYLNLLANTIDNFTHGLAVAASFLVSRKVRFLSPAVRSTGEACSQVWCNIQKRRKIRGVFWKVLWKQTTEKKQPYPDLLMRSFFKLGTCRSLVMKSSKLWVIRLNLEKGALTCWWKSSLSELGDCFLITFSPLLQVGFLTTVAILLHEIPHEVRGLCVLPSWGTTRVLHLTKGGLGLVNIFLSLWKLLPLGD